MGMLGSNLFIRTWMKGEQAHLAMESRCYDGSIKTMKEPESIKNIGILNISLLILFEACLIFVVYLTGNFTVI
jgi:cobalt/nickel transport system permease protein